MRQFIAVGGALVIYLAQLGVCDAASFNCQPYLDRGTCPEARICTEPRLSAVANPVDTTVAVDASLLLHVTEPCALRAENCTDSPTSTVAPVGVISSAGAGGVGSVQLPTSSNAINERPDHGEGTTRF